MTYRISCQNGVSLRSLTPDDVSQRWVDWLNDPAVNRYLEVRHRTQDLVSVSRYIQSIERLPGCLFGIFHGEMGHVGNLRVDIDEFHGRATMGILVGERTAQRKGIAKAAVTAGLRWAVDKQGCQKVVASAYENNAASINLFSRCGFVVEGIIENYWDYHGHRVGHVIMGYKNA